MCPSDETLPFCLPRLSNYLPAPPLCVVARTQYFSPYRSEACVQISGAWALVWSAPGTTYYYRSRLTSVCATMEYLIILYYSSTALEPVHKRCHFMAFKPVPDISTTLIIFKLKEHFVHHWLQHKQGKPHPEWIYCSLDFPEPPRTYVVNFAPPAPDWCFFRVCNILFVPLSLDTCAKKECHPVLIVL